MGNYSFKTYQNLRRSLRNGRGFGGSFWFGCFGGSFGFGGRFNDGFGFNAGGVAADAGA